MWEVILNILIAILSVATPLLVGGIAALNRTINRLDNRVSLLEQSENMNKTFIERLPCSNHISTINKNSSDLEITKRDIMELKNTDNNYRLDITKLYEERNSIMLLLQEIKGQITIVNNNFNNFTTELSKIKSDIKDIQEDIRKIKY
jgi:chromosome segregation ATPase